MVEWSERVDLTTSLLATVPIIICNSSGLYKYSYMTSIHGLWYKVRFINISLSDIIIRFTYFTKH